MDAIQSLFSKFGKITLIIAFIALFSGCANITDAGMDEPVQDEKIINGYNTPDIDTCEEEDCDEEQETESRPG